jgi:hypothetical protein
LGQAIEELRRSLDNNVRNLAPPRSLPTIEFEDFFSAATRAFDNNLFYSSAITAAQGFENAVRRVADQAGIPSNSRGLGVLLMQLGLQGPEWSALVRARNFLVHQASPDSVRKEQAEQLIASFRKGVDALFRSRL